jgi:hypothetical protein
LQPLSAAADGLNAGITEENMRMDAACGFALLQAARKQVAVDRLQQSRQPAWAVLAYHSLRVLPAYNGEAEAIDDKHFVIYSYWINKEVGSWRFVLQVLAAQAYAREPVIGAVLS